MNISDLRLAGHRVRSEVQGAEYVDRSYAQAERFGADFQDVATAFCWGGVWARDGLSLRDRSMITVAILAALARPEELTVHLQPALRNGLSLAELEEIFIHCSTYAGIAAGAAAVKATQHWLAKTEATPDAAAEEIP